MKKNSAELMQQIITLNQISTCSAFLRLAQIKIVFKKFINKGQKRIKHNRAPNVGITHPTMPCAKGKQDHFGGLENVSLKRRGVPGSANLTAATGGQAWVPYRGATRRCRSLLTSQPNSDPTWLILPGSKWKYRFGWKTPEGKSARVTMNKHRRCCTLFSE